MSVFGGGGGALTAATLRVPVVLDLDAFRAGLERAKKEGAAAGKEMGAGGPGGGPGGTTPAAKERERRIDYLAKAVFLAKTAWQAANKLLDRVSQAVHRLAEYRGAGDPATSSFLRLEASATKAFDSFVLGTLKSQVVQKALGALADAAKNAAEWAKGLGERIDRWAKENAAGVAYFVGVVRGMGQYFVELPGLVMDSFRVIAGGIATIAGKVIEFLAALGDGIGSVLDWVGFERAAKSVRRLSSEWESFGESLADLGQRQIADGLEGVGAGLERVGRAAVDVEAKVANMLERVDPAKAGDPMLSEQQQTILKAMDDVANRVGDSWQAATERVGKLFDDLSKDMFFTAEEQQLFGGASRMLAGFSTLGAQAEAAFGRSSRAAQIFARAQIAAQGLVALVEGTMEVGEAFKASADPKAANGSAVQHGAAAAAFFAAAGIAGARAAGLVGSPGRGGAGGRDTALDTRASLTETTERTPVVVLLHIEGNVLGSEEYLKDSLMPRMQNLILEKGVTFAASDLANGGRV